MTNFLTSKEKKISNEFESNGFLIRDIEDRNSLKKLNAIFLKLYLKNLNIKKKIFNNKNIFNLTHQNVEPNNLNNFRLNIINEINKKKEVRELYLGGASGSIIGRNSFQRPYNDALNLLDQILNIYRGK